MKDASICAFFGNDWKKDFQEYVSSLPKAEQTAAEMYLKRLELTRCFLCCSGQ